MRPLSYSQISRYQTCPLWYKLLYIDRLKPKPRFQLSFGDIIHQCAEYFYKVPVPPPPTLEKLLQFYENNWISEGYESPIQEQQYKSYGRDLLRDFWKIHAANFRMPLAVEYQFSINVDGIILGGKIDRVDRLLDGVSIVDYKTNQNPFSMEQLEQDLQLTFYQLAVESTWKLPVKRLTLYHLRTNIPFSCDGRPPEKLEEARQIISNVAEGIQKKEFPAIENSLCDYCDFQQHCPYHKDKFSEEQPLNPEVKRILNGQSAREIVEQYAGLQNRKKEIEAQLDELKQMICNYCEAQDIKRIYGSDHALTYRIMERTGFPEEAVRSLLEPVGLWSRVMKFDPSLVKDLLEDEALKSELRACLATLKEVKSSAPYLFVKKLKEDT